MDVSQLIHEKFRELVLEKCKRDKRRQARAIFEREPFGELERLTTQKILDVLGRGCSSLLSAMQRSFV